MDTASEYTQQPSSRDATLEDSTLSTKRAAVNNADTEALSEATTVTPLAAKFQQITDQALQFLSSASNETLGACIVGLGATTYFVLGRVGLVLIGAVGGVVLHAAWEHSAEDLKDGEARVVERKRRKQIGLDIVSRALEWRRTTSGENKEETEEAASDSRGSDAARLDFAAFQPSTAAAMTGLTEAVIRDYVK